MSKFIATFELEISKYKKGEAMPFVKAMQQLNDKIEAEGLEVLNIETIYHWWHPFGEPKAIRVWHKTPTRRI